MTTEKMTVHEALCELKTLDSRIDKAIQGSVFVFANKHANTKVSGLSIDKYCEEIKSSYQSAKGKFVLLPEKRFRAHTAPLQSRRGVQMASQIKATQAQMAYNSFQEVCFMIKVNEHPITGNVCPGHHEAVKYRRKRHD